MIMIYIEYRYVSAFHIVLRYMEINDKTYVEPTGEKNAVLIVL